MVAPYRVGNHLLLLQEEYSGSTGHTHTQHTHRVQQAEGTSFLMDSLATYQNSEEIPLRKVSKAHRHHLTGLTLTLLPQTEGVKTEPFENHPALEIAEQLTLLDHLVFKSIPYE